MVFICISICCLHAINEGSIQDGVVWGRTICYFFFGLLDCGHSIADPRDGEADLPLSEWSYCGIYIPRS